MQSNPEGREVERGLTRREALKRGAKLGAAIVWAPPVVQSLAMTPALAQTTSPVPTTEPEVEGSTVTSQDTTATSNGGSTATSNGGSTEPTDGEGAVSTEGTTADTVKGIIIENDGVAAEELPFTGLPLEQLLPLAGGALATGAAMVRLARERTPEDSDQSAE